MHLFFQHHLKIFYAVINYIMFHRLCACWIIILNILTQHFVLHVGPKWRRRQRPRNPEDLQEAEGEGAGQWCARETCQAKNRKGGYGCPYCNKLMKGDLSSTINHAVGTSQGSIKNGYAFRVKHAAYADYLMRLLWGFREVRTLAARTDALLVLTMLSTTLCYTLLVNVYGRTMCTSTTKWCLLLYIWKRWTKVELC